MKQEDLDQILKKPGYGIQSSLGKGAFKSELGKTALRDNAGSEGKASDVERVFGHESIPAQRFALNYSGRVLVRIKFYRRRLADYSRANCEKFVIDAARYAGLLLDDSEAHMELIDEGQVKVATPEEERIEMTMEYESVDFDDLWIVHPRQDGR